MSRKVLIVVGAVLALVLAAGGGAYVAMSYMGHMGGFGAMHMSGHGVGENGIMPGQPGHTVHDEVNMPGLQGANATPEESAELAVMFNNFETISRTVENLPNGIKTVTNSSDPDVMAALVSHVSGMIGRVEAKDDPQIMIQSPTLDIFFERGDEITTDINVTDEGIVVTQTTDDPELIDAMHTHAQEVSAMADRGMQAVHEMMMASGDSH